MLARPFYIKNAVTIIMTMIIAPSVNLVNPLGKVSCWYRSQSFRHRMLIFHTNPRLMYYMHASCSGMPLSHELHNCFPACPTISRWQVRRQFFTFHRCLRKSPIILWLSIIVGSLDIAIKACQRRCGMDIFHFVFLSNELCLQKHHAVYLFLLVIQLHWN